MNEDPPVHTTTTEGVTAPPDFTTFMRNYQDMVYSTAVRLIGNETQAEDIAQEVFIKAHAHFENLRTSPSAGGWLKTVATNLSINHIQRYKKRWSFFSDLVHKDDEGGEKEVEFAAPDTFFAGVDSSERREWVERALEKLPDHQRIPLVLYHFDELALRGHREKDPRVPQQGEDRHPAWPRGPREDPGAQRRQPRKVRNLKVPHERKNDTGRP